MTAHRPSTPVIIDHLVADPVFAALPAPTMERLGRTVERQRAPAGTAVVVQGDVGDHYFLIVDGEFTVTKDGRDRQPPRAGTFIR